HVQCSECLSAVRHASHARRQRDLDRPVGPLRAHQPKARGSVSLAPRRRCSAHRIALFALLAMVAGCGPRLHTLPPGTKIPDLRGVWRGVWGNSQVLITLTANVMGDGA